MNQTTGYAFAAPTIALMTDGGRRGAPNLAEEGKHERGV
jgi:hypothetical protein